MSCELSPSAADRYLDAAHRLQLIHQGSFAGSLYWQPDGLRVYEKLRSYIRRKHDAAGYLEVKSPSLVGIEAFARSGHLDKYRENMFVLGAPEGGAGDYAMRPMSCPNHIEIYACRQRSFRELPLRLFEFGTVYRNEASGALQCLFRMREFTQDDAHVFLSDDQVADSVAQYLQLAAEVYRELGFEQVDYSLSLRPAERFGDDARWDQAEAALRAALARGGLQWDEQPGGGAFYGPKIELGVRDKLGRRWQLGTVQLDYVLAGRFGLDYVRSDNARGEPVIVHHAVLGSLERMIGILLEVHGVNLPAFLMPREVAVLPVAQAQEAHARRHVAALQARGVDAVLDASNETLPARVARWKSRGVPQLHVIGRREVAACEQAGGWRAQVTHRDGRSEPVELQP